MIDSKKQKQELHSLAVSYKESKSEKTLIKLNKLMWAYLMNKTYRGLTDNIMFHVRKEVATDVISKLITTIDKLNLHKYPFTAILAQTFKQMLIKYYKKESKYVLHENNDFMDRLQVQRHNI